jgi:putative NADPH-quinone reductase
MIVTSDAPTLYNFLMYFNAPVVVMKKAVLGFCGFKPVRVTTLGNIKSKSRVELEQILEKMKKLGSTGH